MAHRIRGALGIGVVWAIFWGLVVLAVAVADTAARQWAMASFTSSDLAVLMRSFAFGAFLGLLGGLVFSSVLASTMREDPLGRLPMWRFTVGGGLAGLANLMALVLLGVLGPFGSVMGLLTYGVVFPLLGATSAALTLSVARRAPAVEAKRDRPLTAG